MTSILSMIPEETKERLALLGNASTMTAWAIGDETNNLIEKLPGQDIDAIYRAVGTLTGKRDRTVRDYARISKFYSHATRQEFNVLPFSHFRHAMKFGADGWRAVLEISLRQADNNGGIPPSVEWLELACKPADGASIERTAAELDYQDAASGVTYEAIDAPTADDIIDVSDLETGDAWQARKAAGMFDAAGRYVLKLPVPAKRKMLQLLSKLMDKISQSME